MYLLLFLFKNLCLSLTSEAQINLLLKQDTDRSFNVCGHLMKVVIDRNSLLLNL